MGTNKPWYKQKTFWAGIGIAVAGAATLMGDLGVNPAIGKFLLTLSGALSVIFLRDAVNGGG